MQRGRKRLGIVIALVLDPKERATGEHGARE
jgi:hypothetical protein